LSDERTSPDIYDPATDPPLTDLVVCSDLVAAKQPEEVIISQIEQFGYSEDAVFGIKLALEEAMTNAVRHGNRHDASKRIRVRYAVSPRRVIIFVADEGAGFCPEEVPDPTAPENIERPNGRGIMLINAYMTRVSYNAAGNEVRMMKANERWAP